MLLSDSTVDIRQDLLQNATIGRNVRVFIRVRRSSVGEERYGAGQGRAHPWDEDAEREVRSRDECD